MSDQKQTKISKDTMKNQEISTNTLRNKKSAWRHRPRIRVQKSCTVPEGYKFKVKQSFRDECDINRIVKKYEETGVMSHLSKNAAVYSGMFVTPKNAYDAIERVERAKEVFLEIPARIRDQFQNDPGIFYNFASDPKNQDALRKLFNPNKAKGGTPPAAAGATGGATAAPAEAGAAQTPPIKKE